MFQALAHGGRATGWVSLLMLTAAMVLGTGAARRFAVRRRGPVSVRLIGVLHAELSLLTAAFLGLHVAGEVSADTVVVRWVDALVPFISGYQRWWLGLGTVALDLLLAVVVSSLLRPRLGLRAWRIIHWSSYALFPAAVAHSLGIDALDAWAGWLLVLIASWLVSALR